MRPTQAKDHPADGPPPGPRLVPVPGSPARTTADAPGGSPEHTGPVRAPDPGPGSTPDLGPGAALPAGTGDARAVDADVPAAVGRMLDHVLADRLDRARLVDPLFARDLAERVTAFTRHGGKRTRAQLLWWSLRACGGADLSSAAAALRLGAAVELLQTCALVHDDVMDQAVLRRGRPALHTDVSAAFAGRATPERARRSGEAAAILAGDLALAWADDLVAETPLPAWTAVVVRRLWSDMRTEMVAGQYLDLHGQTTGALSLPRALRAACLKSALYSVERPLALGAALAGADDATLRALCSAGRCVGMAFQLRDDLDDAFGNPRHTGKPGGGDIREGKPTYLIALARARAEAADDDTALAVLDHCVGNAAVTPRDLAEVRRVLDATGARATVETKIERLVAQGMRHFDSALLEPQAARTLRRLLRTTGGAGTADPRAASELPDADVARLRSGVSSGGPGPAQDRAADDVAGFGSGTSGGGPRLAPGPAVDEVALLRSGVSSGGPCPAPDPAADHVAGLGSGTSGGGPRPAQGPAADDVARLRSGTSSSDPRPTPDPVDDIDGLARIASVAGKRER